jgi:hypothetical protein
MYLLVGFIFLGKIIEWSVILRPGMSNSINCQYLINYNNTVKSKL